MATSIELYCLRSKFIRYIVRQPANKNIIKLGSNNQKLILFNLVNHLKNIGGIEHVITKCNVYYINLEDELNRCLSKK
jgi:hypothetical protein